ncbi:hypothetical protein IQ02_02586 [Flavobacterium glaciei]|uniref:Uncharacterized protein n=1 Tax=Flavobacterium glaciei TaxID=386300 RepID=A0A562PJT7_9FLAO|nr:hypothetical protein DFR66_11432 [Flavobacterium glaciei]TWI44593.1 hypothetical protein IQ02_02586 [Flavobacterium glaciei]
MPYSIQIKDKNSNIAIVYWTIIFIIFGFLKLNWKEKIGNSGN